MTFYRPRQAPLALTSAKKRQVRTQFGAICHRVHKGRVQVLLITSRGKGRWIIPKGWPMAETTPAEAAAIEAYEEAGVRGTSHPICVGIYSYCKGRNLPCVVALYEIKVDRLMRRFPERGQRKRRWFYLKDAARAVDEPELAQLLAQFRPDGLPRPL